MPVTVTPYAKTGATYTKCCGEPVVTSGRNICGGTKNGKCEVCPDMDCGWERIIQRLKAHGRLDVLKCPIQMHDFNTDEATKAAKESE